MNSVPVLQTQRLILRGMMRADFTDFAALWADPEVVRHILPAPRSAAESWRSFLVNAGSWSILGMGLWMIAAQDTGRFIGVAGFFDGTRGLGTDFDGLPECGWLIRRADWGQGYAQEAVGAAHRWFDGQGHVANRVIIDPQNGASLRVAAAMGYAPMRQAEVAGDVVQMLGRAVPAVDRQNAQ